MEGKTSLLTLRYELLEYIIRLEDEKDSILELASRVNDAVEAVNKMEALKKRVSDREVAVGELQESYLNMKRKAKVQEEILRQEHQAIEKHPIGMLPDEIELKIEKENGEKRKSCCTGCNSPSTFSNLQETKGELEALRLLRSNLNEDLRNTKNDMRKVKSELETEQNQHLLTSKRLAIAGDQVKHVNRVSSLALGEFTNLKKRYDGDLDFTKLNSLDAASEIAMKKIAEEQLKNLEEQNKKDEKIKALLSQIDDLYLSSEKERRENANKIKEQEDEIRSLADFSNLSGLQEKLNTALQQLDETQKKLTDAEERASKSESEVRTLYTRLAFTEKEVLNQSKVLPPPPPPPPPPPLPGPVLKKFISKISGSNKKKKLSDVGCDDPQVKAMEDVVSKIKEGVKLRSVSSSTYGKDGNSSFQRSNKQDGDGAVFGARASLRKTSVKNQNSNGDFEDGPSNELKEKLLRQKSLAERKDNYARKRIPEVKKKSFSIEVRSTGHAKVRAKSVSSGIRSIKVEKKPTAKDETEKKIEPVNISDEKKSPEENETSVAT